MRPDHPFTVIVNTGKVKESAIEKPKLELIVNEEIVEHSAADELMHMLDMLEAYSALDYLIDIIREEWE